jgi:hypothetical protein
MTKNAALILLCLLLLAPAGARAASPWTAEPGYFKKSWAKLEFGLNNALLGWSEIWTEPMYYEASEPNFFARAGKRFGLLAKGIFEAGVCTAGGVIHTATFPIPVDLPLPGNGVQAVQ